MVIEKTYAITKFIYLSVIKNAQLIEYPYPQTQWSKSIWKKINNLTSQSEKSAIVNIWWHNLC